jgi:ATP-dependent DNA helicase RecG
MVEASKQDLMQVLEKALPKVLSDEQKSKKVSNLLQAMKREGLIATRGMNRYAKLYKL